MPLANVIPAVVVPSIALEHEGDAYYLLRESAPKWQGPVYVGGIVYLVAGHTPTPGTNVVQVLKSLNGGNTWAIADQSQAPKWSDVSVQWDKNSSKFHIAARSADGTQILFYTFDCVAGVWGGSPFSAVTLPIIGGAYSFLYVNDSTFYLFYGQNFGNFSYSINGGAFIPVKSNPQESYSVSSFASDGTNAFAVLYWNNPFTSSTDNLDVYRFNSSGSITYASLVSSHPGGNVSSTDVNRVCIYRPSSDEIIFDDTKPNGSSREYGVWRGTPSSSPIWTYELVFNGNLSGTALVNPMLSFDQNGVYDKLYASLNAGFVSGGGGFASSIYATANAGGGWSVPQLVWDSNSAPPVLPDGWTWQGILHSSLTEVEDGNLAWIVGGEALNQFPGEFPCDFILYASYNIDAGFIALQVGVFDTLVLSDSIQLPQFAAITIAVADSLFLTDFVPSPTQGGGGGGPGGGGPNENCPDIIVNSDYCAFIKTSDDDTSPLETSLCPESVVTNIDDSTDEVGLCGGTRIISIDPEPCLSGSNT